MFCLGGLFCLDACDFFVSQVSAWVSCSPACVPQRCCVVNESDDLLVRYVLLT